MSSLRYSPFRPLPPYTYVPNQNPHPTSDPRGHSFGHTELPPAPLTPENYHTNAAYLYALDLFNHAYYWEAHETWESLWHAAGRHGPTADFLKGLIKLAAAGVKLKEGRPAGVRTHALRALELLRSAQHNLAPNHENFGINLDQLIPHIQRLTTAATVEPASNQLDVTRLLPLKILLERTTAP